LLKCDLKILKKALKEINKLIIREIISKVTPAIISLFFIVNEIFYIKNNINLIQQDVYLHNVLSVIVLLKMVIIFFVLPLFLFEKSVNHFLRLDSQFFPISFFYNSLYFLIFLIVTIKVFEYI